MRQRECDGNGFSHRRHRFFTIELVTQADGLPATAPEDAMPLSNAQIMDLARAHTSFNDSHAMTDFVGFARAVVAAVDRGEVA